MVEAVSVIIYLVHGSDFNNRPLQMHVTICCREQLYERMADILASAGYRDAGYEYVAIDDCWMERERDAQGRLVANAKRFPSGIAHLADYVSE